MNLSLSASPAESYYWMRYVGTSKPRVVTSDTGAKVTIPAKSLFGVKEVRGKNVDEILLEDGTRFRLTIKKSESLMDASKPYRGKLPALKAKAAPKATPVKGSVPKSSAGKPKTITQPVKLKAIPITKLGEMLKAQTIKVKVVANKDPRKATVTQMTGQPNAEAPRNVKVKLSELHLPEVEDFADTELPEEFRRYQVVESTGVKVEKITISLSEEIPMAQEATPEAPAAEPVAVEPVVEQPAPEVEALPVAEPAPEEKKD